MRACVVGGCSKHKLRQVWRTSSSRNLQFLVIFDLLTTLLLNQSFQASVVMDTPGIVNLPCKPFVIEHFSSLKCQTAWSYSSSCSPTLGALSEGPL